MNLQAYFKSQCGNTAKLLNTHTPAIKKIVSGKKKEPTGVVGTLSFDGFKIDISYYELGKTAYAQQTIWISFVLDSDPTLPFSIYDILATLQAENFNCYTYTYVDSNKLMDECFDEINALLKDLVPQLIAYLQNGTDKNRLIISQRESINSYFGDKVLEQGEMLGGAADNIINMMLRNFHQAQIEAAVIGSQSLFYAGKDAKALKKLKKAKCLTPYQKNLLAHLEKGGTSANITETAKKASSEKGTLRHGGGIAGALKIIGLSLLLSVPVTLILTAIFYICCLIMFKDALFVTGFWENAVLMPPFSSVLCLGLAIRIINKRRETKKIKSPDSVQSPKTPHAVNNLFKYFIIAGETLAVIGVFTSIFSATPFYNDGFGYSETDFPTSHRYCEYKSVEYIAYINGYNSNGKFYESPYIAVKTKSGAVIDLYNSTGLTAKTFKENAGALTEKGIEIKEFDTIEDIK